MTELLNSPSDLQSEPGRRIVSIREAGSRSKFDCGEPGMDAWFHTQAGQQERSGNTRTFVMLDSDAAIIGYYSSRTLSLTPSEQEDLDGASHRYPLPAILLARLAVDRRYQGQGFSKELLGAALLRLADVSNSVGFEIVLVHPLDTRASNLYSRFGFERFSASSRAMFLTVKDLRAAAYG